MKQEDPLRSYSLVSAIVCLFDPIIVLKFVGNEYTSQQNEEHTQQIPKKYWIPESYDERKIPEVINKLMYSVGDVFFFF